ncbi:unnamed protein product [Didymodactylos carnosus]|uniref:Uncharacterized protein n=1 Tax=Didymodactylos carnosus TaxID=1234261 RepID=A0A8S2CNK7_9BILA|nr:unnamed protein product [Didymodactylos carnosus]CAF3515565.1 unnamed protein product [Didymodactylos carnosus]
MFNLPFDAWQAGKHMRPGSFADALKKLAEKGEGKRKTDVVNSSNNAYPSHLPLPQASSLTTCQHGDQTIRLYSQHLSEFGKREDLRRIYGPYGDTTNDLFNFMLMNRPYDWDNLSSTKSYSTKHTISLEKVENVEFESFLKSNETSDSQEMSNISSSNNQQYYKNHKEYPIPDSLALVSDNDTNTNTNGCKNSKTFLVQNLTQTAQCSKQSITNETDTSNILNALDLASAQVSKEDEYNSYHFENLHDKSTQQTILNESDRKRKSNNSKLKLSHKKHFKRGSKLL